MISVINGQSLVVAGPPQTQLLLDFMLLYHHSPDCIETHCYMDPQLIYTQAHSADSGDLRREEAGEKRKNENCLSGPLFRSRCYSTS